MNRAARKHDFHDDHALLDVWAGIVTPTLRAVRVLGDELEAEFGLPMAEAEVLLRLYRAPLRQLPTTRLAKDLLFTSGGFTKLADRLEAQGLVAREPCQTDRRITFLTLTPHGRALAQKTLKAHAAGIRRHVLAHTGEETLSHWYAAASHLPDPSAAHPPKRDATPEGERDPPVGGPSADEVAS